jgi:hypothetical protein
LSGSFERRVSGRKRTSIDIPLDCVCRDKSRRTAIPSSPAPKTRTRVFPMVWFGVMASLARLHAATIIKTFGRGPTTQGGAYNRCVKGTAAWRTSFDPAGRPIATLPHQPFEFALADQIAMKAVYQATGHCTPAISTGSWLRRSASGGLAAELASGRTPVKCRRHIMSMQPRHLAFDITEQGGASLKPYRTDPGQRAVDCRRYRQGHVAPDACAIRSGLRGRDRGTTRPAPPGSSAALSPG